MIESKAEELLRLGRTIKAQQRRIEAKLRELDAYDGYGAANMDGMPRGASVGRDAQIVEQRIDLRRSLEDLEILLEGVKPYIKDIIIMAHAPTEAGLRFDDVGRCRFVSLMSCAEIAQKLFGKVDYVGIRYVKARINETVSFIANGSTTNEAARVAELILLHDFGAVIRKLKKNGNLKTKLLFCEKIPCAVSLDGE